MVEYWTTKEGDKKFWKLDINVLNVDLRSLRRRIHENRDLGSGRSNIAKKKLTKWDTEVLEAEKKSYGSWTDEVLKGWILNYQSRRQEVLKIEQKCFERWFEKFTT